MVWLATKAPRPRGWNVFSPFVLFGKIRKKKTSMSETNSPEGSHISSRPLALNLQMAAVSRRCWCNNSSQPRNTHQDRGQTEQCQPDQRWFWRAERWGPRYVASPLFLCGTWDYNTLIQFFCLLYTTFTFSKVTMHTTVR